MAIRIVTLGYVFVGANVAFQAVFQALGSGIRSLALSLIRLVVVALPLAYLFTLLPNAADMVWIAFPAAEICAFIVAVVFMGKVRKNMIANI